MASLIKNQIVKHLSKFAKNLSPDQISVEILRGKSELKNIELNEEVLTDALELPAWLKIKKARCNRIVVRVPWTRLKSAPVQLFIDEVTVQVELSSEMRPPPKMGPNMLSAYSASDNSYGFANRVAEGMSLYINTLEMEFTSEMFGGSIMLSRLSIESRTPGWLTATDLRMTRIADSNTNQALLFKQISWQLLRVEASARRDRTDNQPHGPTINAPLRLITSQGRCRVAVKKSNVDGSVVAGRIQVILDDILWVATLPQVRSAIVFYRHLIELVNKAAEMAKAERAQKAWREAVHAHAAAGTPTHKQPAQAQQPPKPGPIPAASAAFKHFDFRQTSYHCYIGKIDLHLCDDAHTGPQYPLDWDIDSGALQVTLLKFALDVYPYHLASGDRSHWVRYKNQTQFSKWVGELLAHYKSIFTSTLDGKKQQEMKRLWPQLMSQSCVLRVDDLIVHCVSDTSTKRDSLEKLISSDRDAIASLPGDQPLLHVEFGDFFYPDSADLPVPPSCSHILLSPLRVLLDLRTIRWILYVYQDICNTLDLKDGSLDGVPHTDVRIEALMPKMIIPAPNSAHIQQPKKPSQIIVQLSTVILTNCLIGDNIDPSALKVAASRFSDNALFQPVLSVGNRELTVLPLGTTAFGGYMARLCEVISSQSQYHVGPTTAHEYKADSAASDLWCIKTSPVWMEFSGSPVYYPKPMPFVSDAPWTIFAVPNVDKNNAKLPDVFLLAEPQVPVKIALDHYQYLQLIRTIEAVSKFVDMLDADERFFTKKSAEALTTKSVVLSCSLDRVEVHLILPVEGPISPFDDRSSTSKSQSLDLPPLDSTPAAPNSDNALTQNSSEVSLARVKEETNRRRDDSDSPAFPDFPQGLEQDASSNIDETMSIATDASDDDQFVVLDTPEGAPFDDVFREENQGRVAVAEEALEVVGPSNNEFLERILSEKVSVLTAKLTNMDLLMGSANQCSRIKIQGRGIAIGETIGVPLSQVYAEINSKEPVSRENPPPATAAQFPLTMEIRSTGAKDKGALTGHVTGLKLSIGDATLSNLGAFLQDDNPEEGMSVKIRVDDTALTIIDAKKPDALRILVQSSMILQGGVPDEAPSNGPTNRLVTLEKENEELRRKLGEATELLQKMKKETLK